MQCSCGGETVDCQVIRDKEVAGKYAKCTACGRIQWVFKNAALDEELRKKCLADYEKTWEAEHNGESPWDQKKD